MVKEGIMEHGNRQRLSPESNEMQQIICDTMTKMGEAEGRSHFIEGRIYAENPYEGSVTSPSLLQHVCLNEFETSWLRIDSWVRFKTSSSWQSSILRATKIETGMIITPHFDHLLAKLVVAGSSRALAIERYLLALGKCRRLLGPPQNVHYLTEIASSNKTFRAGQVTTNLLQTFSVQPKYVSASEIHQVNV
jgi:acetyl/propionyl-CoA carboxylase alpha subunit